MIGMVRAAMAAALLALAGCGTDTDQTLASQTVRAFAGSLVQGPAKQAGGLVLTRAEVDAFPEPLMLIAVEGTGAAGGVVRTGVNAGVETWASSDRKTVALRGGLLVGTRGLGADLMAASVPDAGRIAAGGSWTRLHVTLNGEDQTVRTRYSCTAGTVGPAEVVIVERRYSTRLVRETCTALDGTGPGFQNEYWFEGGSNLRQSRQWIGPLLGHVAIRRL